MTFKPFLENDKVSTRTLLHEAVPITGTILSGTYADANIKNYGHGMFQSVFDYPFLSASSNHIFDISTGISANSSLYSTVANQQAKKKNVYNSMAQVLMGYSAEGAIQEFDEDGDISGGGNKLRECFVIPFSRLLTKDEIKKETVSLTLGVGTYADPFASLITISDISASTEYRVNSPAGEYGILYATGSGQLNIAKTGNIQVIDGVNYWRAGLVFYQAGVMILTSSVFGDLQGSPSNFTATENINAVLTGSQISGAADALRHRTQNIEFNNTTELNSTVYFARVNHNEFNYSSNQTYVSGSRIRVKTVNSDVPVSYITTIGLYNDNNELMATAKLSEPLKKSASNEFTLRVRLDY